MESLRTAWAAFVDWATAHAALGWWSIALSVVVSVGGIFLVRWAVVRIPADYFVRRRPSGWQRLHPVARGVLVASKNLLGALLLVLGLTMLITPGPGILALLIAVMLLDIPGKAQLERRIVTLPSVLHVINRIRRQANRPAIELPAGEPGK